MRKVIAVLMIVSAVGFYMQHMMQVGKAPHQEVIGENKCQEQLKDYKEQLQYNYPKEIEEVMKIYNKLLHLGYNEKMTETQIDQYIEVVRLMYTSEFLELNPVEIQKEQFVKEVSLARQEGQNEVLSMMETMNIIKEEKGEGVEATITVKHITSSSGVERRYLFIKQDGLWKINGWQSI